MNPWSGATIWLFFIATGFAIGCAYYSIRVYWRFKASIAGKAKMAGYILLAMAFTTFASLGLVELPVQQEQFFRFIGIVFVALGLGALLLGLWDFNRFLGRRN